MYVLIWCFCKKNDSRQEQVRSEIVANELYSHCFRLSTGSSSVGRLLHIGLHLHDLEGRLDLHIFRRLHLVQVPDLEGPGLAHLFVHDIGVSSTRPETQGQQGETVACRCRGVNQPSQSFAGASIGVPSPTKTTGRS